MDDCPAATSNYYRRARVSVRADAVRESWLGRLRNVGWSQPGGGNLKRKRLITLVMLGVLVSAAALVRPGPALAVGLTGTTYQNVGSSSSKFAVQSWNGNSNTAAVSADLSMTPASGYCLDSWFDWRTPEGRSHYDARGVRVCRANASHGSGTITESNSVGEMQKAGGAYGPNNATTSYQYTNAPTADSGQSVASINVVMTTSNCTVAWWKKDSSGGISSWGGGSPTSAGC